MLSKNNNNNDNINTKRYYHNISPIKNLFHTFKTALTIWFKFKSVIKNLITSH